MPGEAAAGILISTPPHARICSPCTWPRRRRALQPSAPVRRGGPGVEPAADAPPADRAESLPTLLDRLLAMTRKHVDAIQAMVSG